MSEKLKQSMAESFSPPAQLDLFVKEIMIFSESDPLKETTLPFFADGYPGLIFFESENGLLVTPHNKKMPVFFLYGQTLQPVNLQMSGRYSMIVFQLYPFVLKSFFGVEPQSINDNCYDLTVSPKSEITSCLHKLSDNEPQEEKVEIISSLLESLLESGKKSLDLDVAAAIRSIMESGGQENIESIINRTNLGRRTFERRFLKATGITASRFSQIIRFQSSLGQLSASNYEKLTDIVYANGYADQSHFIRTFRAFTGKTPGTFQK